jgi:CRP-like cAMP-binding protein
VLVGLGEAVLEPLAYFLNDPDENIWVRRHIPATLALLPTQRSVDILVDSLNASDGFLRYKAVTAIEKLRRTHPQLVVPRATIEALVLRECSRYNEHKALRADIVQRDGQASSLVVRALDDKLARTIDRIYRLLSLIYPWKDIDAARRAIESGDRRTRTAAFEFLDNLLKGLVRAPVIGILEGSPDARPAATDLKTRSRDLDETLALLVRDDDQVLAAAAIHLVQQRQRWSLASELEFERAHRGPEARYVVEAATWALALRQGSDVTGPERWMTPLPVVELADRIRKISLFDFVSVDELFRIAATGRQVRHEAGRELYHAGLPPEDVHFLLDGSVQVSGRDGAVGQLSAPAALAFEEVLQGSPLAMTIGVVDHAVCLALGRAEFLTMLSDNIALAQGLFRMLLDTPNAQQWRTVHTPLEEETLAPRNLPLSPLDKVLLLRRNPLLARATVGQLRELAGITHEVPLAAGNVLFAPNDKPVLYHVVDGEVRLESDGGTPVVAGPGCTIGVAEILAGVPVGRRATVLRSGQALRLDHEELYDVLADHIDLLQSLFSGLITARQPKRRENPGLREATRVIAV